MRTHRSLLIFTFICVIPLLAFAQVKAEKPGAYQPKVRSRGSQLSH